MSKVVCVSNKSKSDKVAEILAALGNPIRLALVERLSTAETVAGLSITELTEEGGLTRQAITKHLETLEEAGLVNRLKLGRGTWYELRNEPLKYAKEAITALMGQRAQAERTLKIAKKEFSARLKS